MAERHRGHRFAGIVAEAFIRRRIRKKEQVGAGDHRFENPGEVILCVRQHRGEQEVRGGEGQPEGLAFTTTEKIERSLGITQDVAGMGSEAEPAAGRGERLADRIAERLEAFVSHHGVDHYGLERATASNNNPLPTAAKLQGGRKKKQNLLALPLLMGCAPIFCH